MAAHDSPVGKVGTVIVATRGEKGPGEVLIKIGGGTEAYIAWSQEPLAKGATVLVFNSRGSREVDVTEFEN